MIKEWRLRRYGDDGASYNFFAGGPIQSRYPHDIDGSRPSYQEPEVSMGRCWTPSLPVLLDVLTEIFHPTTTQPGRFKSLLEVVNHCDEFVSRT